MATACMGQAGGDDKALKSSLLTSPSFPRTRESHETRRCDSLRSPLLASLRLFNAGQAFVPLLRE